MTYNEVDCSNKRGERNMKNYFQRLGRSMLVPIVAMPMAGILIRLTAGDMLNIPVFQAAGTIFGNMDVILAVGIAMGMTHTKDRGIPALTGLLSIFVLKEGLKILDPSLNMSVFGGVMAGLIAAFIYNKFKSTKLPDAFSFFGGEKFPISMIILTMVPVAFVSSLIWPFFQTSIDGFAKSLLGMGALGIFIFGFLNRFLLPFGLHHVINTYVYFGLGEFTNANGDLVTGEISRFLAGDPTAGFFIGGFFITMMFGLPAAALAMVKRAKKERKNDVKALMASASVTSIVTGITEPIEFSFLFASPLLYGIHAVLTGLAGATLYFLNIRHGFGWGAGLIDFGLNLNLSTSGLLIIPVGLVFGLIYYFIFYYLIDKLNLKVIGREEVQIDNEEALTLSHSNYELMAKKLIQYLGGKENIVDAENCITRLRLTLNDMSVIDEAAIMATGAHGVVKVSDKQLQIVIGPKVSNVMSEFKKFI